MENKPTNHQWTTAAVGVKAGEKADGKEKRLSLHSIRFQTWIYFFLLAVVVLFGLWAFQLLFFKASYRSMKKQEVERLGESVMNHYPGKVGSVEYEDFVRETASHNGLNIIVFHVHETYEGCAASEVEFSAEYVGGLPDKNLIHSNDVRIIDGWESFYTDVKQHDKVIYSKTSKHNTTYLVYGSRLDNNGVYLYMTTPMEALDSTVAIMNDQLIVATLLCLVVSIVVSFFISDRITKPIAEFSRTAKKLGAGDYSVRFTGNGYTEIDTLAETLNYATDEIGKTEQLRRDFLANVSHDLRTPLTMVKAYAEMIRDISGSDAVKRTQHSQVIIDEADRLTGLVNDILNLSKLQAGTETLAYGAVDMHALVKTIVERFDVYTTRDGYMFDIVSDGNCEVYGDSRKLEQVMYNLVGNALNYTGENRTVRIECKRQEDKVRVSVRDYGKGIEPEELEKVWERYYRANQHKRTVVGSGLGLSIVKSILSAHGAPYGVSSKVGEGTEFWFELNAMNAASGETKEKADEKPHKGKSE